MQAIIGNMKAFNHTSAADVATTEVEVSDALCEELYGKERRHKRGSKVTQTNANAKGKTSEEGNRTTTDKRNHGDTGKPMEGEDLHEPPSSDAPGPKAKRS